MKKWRTKSEQSGSSQPVWKTLWKKLKKEKKKLMIRSASVHVQHIRYDEYTYMQNFDQWNNESEYEPDILSRSFSVRYSNRRSAMV